MKKLTPKQIEIIDYLNHCKEAFLSSSDYSFERSLGMTEIIDQLENIRHGGKECYVSYLFSTLTDEDKQAIDREIDFYVNYDELYAIYDL